MRVLRILTLAILLSGFAGAQQAGWHSTTRWSVEPSLKYDAICALDMLSGDPYYLRFYQADYNRLAPLLTPAEKDDIVELKRIIKDRNKGIVAADLALILSVESGDTLDDILVALDHPDDIRARLQVTPYYSAPNFAEFLEVRPHLVAAIRALKRIGFEGDWAQNIRPQVAARAQQLEGQLVKYNIVPLQEQVLGHPLADNRIKVILLYYSEPHGIKITGTRYLTHFSYGWDVALHNAVHEMLHPPYDLRDPSVQRAVETLRQDSFLMDKVKHHDPSLGYNEFEGFVEEDCVQALEQAITQYMGLEEDKRAYWRQQDYGMHVLGIGLYSLMLREHFMEHRETFPHFLERMVFTGQLTNTRLVKLNRDFYGH